MNNSKMNQEENSLKDSCIEKMKEYDFSAPINATVIFIESDEETDEKRSEEPPVLDMPVLIVNSEMTLNDNQVTTVIQEIFSDIDRDVNNGERIAAKRKNETDTDVTKHNKKIDNKSPDIVTAQAAKVLKPIGQETLRETQHNTTPSFHVPNNNEKAPEPITDLLKALSQNILDLLTIYYKSIKMVNSVTDEQCKERYKNVFYKTKKNVFGLNYNTVVSIIIPKENDANFINELVENTAKLGHLKSLNFDVKDIQSMLKDLIDWSKRNRDSIENSMNMLYREFQYPFLGNTLRSDSEHDNLLKKSLATASMPSWQINKNVTTTPNKRNEVNTRLNQNAKTQQEMVSANPRYMNSTCDQSNIIPRNSRCMESVTIQHNYVNPPIYIDSSFTRSPQNLSLDPRCNEFTRQNNCTNQLRPSYSSSWSNTHPHLLQQLTDVAGTQSTVNTMPSRVMHQAYADRQYTVRHFLPNYNDAIAYRNQTLHAGKRNGYRQEAAQPQTKPSQHNLSENMQMQILRPQNHIAVQPYTRTATENNSITMYNALNERERLMPQHIQVHDVMSVETNRSSISRDSGIMSPAGFNNNKEDNLDEASLEFCTPVISHVTSTNINAPYNKEGYCSVCDKVTKNMCLGCYKYYYCSSSCQFSDWVYHKELCKKTI